MIAAAVPESWDVRSDLRSIDGIEGPTVIVMPNEITPGPTMGWDTHELRVRLLTEVTDPAEADDALDVTLPLLLRVIESLDPVVWTNAERGVHADDYHAWTLTVRVPARKERHNG